MGHIAPKCWKRTGVLDSLGLTVELSGDGLSIPVVTLNSYAVNRISVTK